MKHSARVVRAVPLYIVLLRREAEVLGSTSILRQWVGVMRWSKYFSAPADATKVAQRPYPSRCAEN